MEETLVSIERAASEYRRGGGQRLPDGIKRRAVKLLGKHSPAEVALAVGVSCGKVVKGWEAKLAGGRARETALCPASAGEGDAGQPPITFVEFPTRVVAPEVDGALEVDIECDSGCRLRVRGKLGAGQLRALVQATIGGEAGRRQP